jgi:uncharacterized protein YcbK (DUF882 family)
MSEMGDLSANFSEHEFQCPHCHQVKGPTGALVLALQRLRNEVGRPLMIVSGWRCAYYNAMVGGIRRSRHLYGDAADIPGSYAELDQVRRAGFHGVGIRHGRVIHVDVQPGKRFYTFAD